MAQDPPDGSGMEPENLPGAEYGIVTCHNVGQLSLSYPRLPGVQKVSHAVNGTFHIYHDTGHGEDSYLVVYEEAGLVSVVTPGNPMLVTVGDKGDLFRAARGYFLYRMETWVGPVGGQLGGSVSLEKTSPATVNQEREQQDQTVESYSESLNIAVSGDAPSGGATGSHDVQIWHSYTIPVRDWNVDENSDAGSNKGAWMWYQTIPWNGAVNDPSNFSSWWQEAYNMGGGWDDVKDVTDISKTSLQYRTSAAWRFPATLIQNGQLNVQFSGEAISYFALIMMPNFFLDFAGHQALSRSIKVPWNTEFDLVAESQLE